MKLGIILCCIFVSVSARSLSSGEKKNEVNVDAFKKEINKARAQVHPQKQQIKKWANPINFPNYGPQGFGPQGPGVGGFNPNEALKMLSSMQNKRSKKRENVDERGKRSFMKIDEKGVHNMGFGKPPGDMGPRSMMGMGMPMMEMGGQMGGPMGEGPQMGGGYGPEGMPGGGGFGGVPQMGGGSFGPPGGMGMSGHAPIMRRSQPVYYVQPQMY